MWQSIGLAGGEITVPRHVVVAAAPVIVADPLAVGVAVARGMVPRYRLDVAV